MMGNFSDVGFFCYVPLGFARERGVGVRRCTHQDGEGGTRTQGVDYLIWKELKVQRFRQTRKTLRMKSRGNELGGQWRTVGSGGAAARFVHGCTGNGKGRKKGNGVERRGEKRKNGSGGKRQSRQHESRCREGVRRWLDGRLVSGDGWWAVGWNGRGGGRSEL